jgi:hypothetical protein
MVTTDGRLKVLDFGLPSVAATLCSDSQQDVAGPDALTLASASDDDSRDDHWHNGRNRELILRLHLMA